MRRRRCQSRSEIGAAIRRALDAENARFVAELVVIVMTATLIVGGALVRTAFVARALI